MIIAGIEAEGARDTVLKFMASYGGIAALVVILIGGLKTMFRSFVKGREPLFTLVLTLALGVVAKLLLTDVYGGHSVEQWFLHAIVLLFVAVGAKGVHDGVTSPLISMLRDDGKKDGKK